jgi:hypothetical protein
VGAEKAYCNGFATEAQRETGAEKDEERSFAPLRMTARGWQRGELGRSKQRPYRVHLAARVRLGIHDQWRLLDTDPGARKREAQREKNVCWA